MERTWRGIVRDRVHPPHMKMEDPRLRGHRSVYFAQAAIAGVALFVLLAAEDVLVNAAVIAAIASTAFVLMVTPHSVVATLRHTLGDHAVCAVVGSLAAIALASDPGEELAELRLVPELAAALAVAASIVLMGLSDTEHPPAAGTALGFAVVDFDATLLLVLAVSIAALVVAQQLLLPRLRDLL